LSDSDKAARLRCRSGSEERSKEEHGLISCYATGGNSGQRPTLRRAGEVTCLPELLLCNVVSQFPLICIRNDRSIDVRGAQTRNMRATHSRRVCHINGTPNTTSWVL